MHYDGSAYGKGQSILLLFKSSNKQLCNNTYYLYKGLFPYKGTLVPVTNLNVLMVIIYL